MTAEAPFQNAAVHIPPSDHHVVARGEHDGTTVVLAVGDRVDLGSVRVDPLAGLLVGGEVPHREVAVRVTDQDDRLVGADTQHDGADHRGESFDRLSGLPARTEIPYLDGPVSAAADRDGLTLK